MECYQFSIGLLIAIAIFVVVGVAIWPLMSSEMDLHVKKHDKKVRRLAGVIPVLPNGHLHLITSKKTDEYVFPKGGVKKRETMEEGAIRECWEETGLKGRLIAVVPIEDECQWFVMRVTQVYSAFPERGQREFIQVCHTHFNP